MCSHDKEFVLEPNVVKIFSFSFPSLSTSVGTNIEVHVHSLSNCSLKQKVIRCMQLKLS